MVRTHSRLPNRWIISIRRQARTEMERFVLTIRSSWRYSRGSEIFIEPPRFLWCSRPVSWLRRKNLLMHPWDTPSILAIFRWELPSADNLTNSYSICSGNFLAWCPLKVQRKINSLYRNPTLHKSIKVVMARQTSLQVTTHKLTYFLLLSLSGPQTILTVFGHSIWLRNGLMETTVFRSAIGHTARNNKYRSNSHKCHLVVVIPWRWPLVYTLETMVCCNLCLANLSSITHSKQSSVHICTRWYQKCQPFICCNIFRGCVPEVAVQAYAVSFICFQGNQVFA